MAKIFIIGSKVINNNRNKPAMLIPFLIKSEQPITVSKASDKKSPIIGIKLSTANFADFAITPSKLDAANPWTEITPVNAVRTIPNSAIAIPLIRDANLVILIFSLILLIIDSTEEKITNGITTVLIKVDIAVTDV